jgi:hypothetical protein
MRTEATSQFRTSGLPVLDQQPPHGLHVLRSDSSATNYLRLNDLRLSAIQLCQTS